MTASPTTRDGGRSWGHASSVPWMKLLNRMTIVWRQGEARVNRLLLNAPPETRIVHDSACCFPIEIVEMIIAHLTRDLGALKACSLTCYSWYTAAVPHIHRTLVLGERRPDKNRHKLKPLFKLHKLGLVPLIKEIRVDQLMFGKDPWFVPQEFSPRALRYFSAFANVRALALQGLEIHRFIPGIERYFGHLSLTLRSITLCYPRCTPRQLSYFLSLFSNLDDVDISSPRPPPYAAAIDTDLVPFSAPKLQGRLKLRDFDWVETWTDLIASCGSLRFHYMDLRRVGDCAPILLGACAKTLETLQFSPTDDLVGTSFAPRLKVLRSLQVRYSATNPHQPNNHTILVDILSTITSPVFSELALVIEERQIVDLPSDVTFFETLRAMVKVRFFNMIILLNAVYSSHEEARRQLAEALNSVGGFLDLFQPIPLRAE